MAQLIIIDGVSSFHVVHYDSIKEKPLLDEFYRHIFF